MKFLTTHFTGEQIQFLSPIIEMMQSSDVGSSNWELAMLQLKTLNLYTPLMEALKEEYAIYDLTDDFLIFFPFSRKMEIYKHKVMFDVAGVGIFNTSGKEYYSCSHKLPVFSNTLGLKIIDDVEIVNSNNIEYPIKLELWREADIFGLPNTVSEIVWCKYEHQHKISNIIKECEALKLHLFSYDCGNLASLDNLKHLELSFRMFSGGLLIKNRLINFSKGGLPKNLETLSIKNGSTIDLLEIMRNQVPHLPKLHKITLPQDTGDDWEQEMLLLGFVRECEDVFTRQEIPRN